MAVLEKTREISIYTRHKKQWGQAFPTWPAEHRCIVREKVENHGKLCLPLNSEHPIFGPGSKGEPLRVETISFLLGVPLLFVLFFFDRAPFGPGGLVAECIEP